MLLFRIFKGPLLGLVPLLLSSVHAQPTDPQSSVTGGQDTSAGILTTLEPKNLDEYPEYSFSANLLGEHRVPSGQNRRPIGEHLKQLSRELKDIPLFGNGENPQTYEIVVENSQQQCSRPLERPIIPLEPFINVTFVITSQMDPPSGGLPGGPAEASSSNSGLPTNRHLPRLQIPDVNFQFQSYLKDTPKTWIQERRNHRNGLVLQKLVYNITLKVLHRQTGELLRQFTYDITALWTPTALTWESFILAMDNAILSIARCTYFKSVGLNH